MRFGSLRVVATLTFVDGSTASTPDSDLPFDRLMFERKFEMPWLGWDSLIEEHLLFMAWVQLHRADIAGRTLALDDFDLWLLDVASAEFDMSQEADAVLPTVPAASTGS